MATIYPTAESAQMNALQMQQQLQMQQMQQLHAQQMQNMQNQVYSPPATGYAPPMLAGVGFSGPSSGTTAAAGPSQNANPKGPYDSPPGVVYGNAVMPAMAMPVQGGVGAPGAAGSNTQNVIINQTAAEEDSQKACSTAASIVIFVLGWFVWPIWCGGWAFICVKRNPTAKGFGIASIVLMFLTAAVVIIIVAVILSAAAAAASKTSTYTPTCTQRYDSYYGTYRTYCS